MKDYLGDDRVSFETKPKVERSHLRALLFAGALSLAFWCIILPDTNQESVRVKTMRVVIQ